MTAPRPTGEQQAIIDASQSGADLVIEAGAGTGKTSTLRLVAATQWTSPLRQDT
jgi:ATP-dependent exoDNAse (exonuclease V) beta subunit